MKLIPFLFIVFSLNLIAQNENNVKRRSFADKFDNILNNKGIEGALDFYHNLDKDSNYSFAENEINRLGYNLMNQNKIDEAIAVFKINIEQFPNSPNVYDSMGEVYMYSGKLELARENYKKSLELNPQNWNARMVLERMKGMISDGENETMFSAKFDYGIQTGIKGEYFGEEPPVIEPKIFAPGIVSRAGNFEFSITFSPDGKEFYFNSRTEGLMVSRLTDEGWKSPERSPLSEKYGAFEAHFSPDGKKLFFGSQGNIMVIKKNVNGWSEPEIHGPGMYATTSLNGDYYVTDITREKGYGTIVYSEYKEGNYSALKDVNGDVNPPAGSAHPCIAPDGSYIIFDSIVDDGSEGGQHTDLFVCFKNENGSWGKALNLGDKINTPGGNICASITPDGKYLFYNANNDIYWVSTKILEEIKK